MVKAAIVFAYWKGIKYSVNVLVGALEKQLSNDIDIYMAGKDELLDTLVGLSRKYGRGRVIYAQTLLTTELPSILSWIRRANNVAGKLGIIRIAGGPHPSGDPYGTIMALGYDYAFVGESEETFPEFVSGIMEGDLNITSIKGIAYRDGCKVKVTGRGFLKSLDEYPPFGHQHRLFNPIEISRGCPFACKYCQVSYVFSSLPRHRSVANIVSWAKFLISRGIKDIRFITPNSLGYGSKNRQVNYTALEELVSELQKIRCLGGKVYLGSFPSEIRPEQVDEDIVKLLKGAVDNRRVVIGAQSGSSRILKVMNRGHEPDDVIEAVRLLRKGGFDVDVDYIFGLPGETEVDRDETLKHMTRVAEMGARVHAHVFMPLPGTPLSFAPPGRLDAHTLKAIHSLLGRGKVFGTWKAQERIAFQISDLRDKGVIIVTPSRAEALATRYFQC